MPHSSGLVRLFRMDSLQARSGGGWTSKSTGLLPRMAALTALTLCSRPKDVLALPSLRRTLSPRHAEA